MWKVISFNENERNGKKDFKVNLFICLAREEERGVESREETNQEMEKREKDKNMK